MSVNQINPIRYQQPDTGGLSLIPVKIRDVASDEIHRTSPANRETKHVRDFENDLTKIIGIVDPETKLLERSKNEIKPEQTPDDKTTTVIDVDCGSQPCEPSDTAKIRNIAIGASVPTLMTLSGLGGFWEGLKFAPRNGTDKPSDKPSDNSHDHHSFKFPKNTADIIKATVLGAVTIGASVGLYQWLNQDTPEDIKARIDELKQKTGRS